MQSIERTAPSNTLRSILARRPPSPPPFPYTTLFRSHRPSTGPRCPDTRSGIHPARPARPARSAREALCQTTQTGAARSAARSEEHTSELQSRENLVCRLLLEKKKNKIKKRQNTKTL